MLDSCGRMISMWIVHAVASGSGATGGARATMRAVPYVDYSGSKMDARVRGVVMHARWIFRGGSHLLAYAMCGLPARMRSRMRLGMLDLSGPMAGGACLWTAECGHAV